MRANFFTVRQAAEATGVSGSTILRAITNGHLRAEKIDNRRTSAWLITADQLESWARAHTTERTAAS